MSTPPEPRDETPILPEGWLDLVLERTRAPGDGVSGSADARAALARARAHARALAALPRPSAPAELDGRVVAAIHAGHREDRAAAFLASLAPESAPDALRGRVAREIVTGAPAALDRLVESRVAAEMRAGEALPAPPTLPRQRLLAATAAGVALGLVLGLGGLLWALADGAAVADSGLDDSGLSDSAPGFVEFIEVDVDDLAPSDRALLSRLGGPLFGGRS